MLASRALSPVGLLLAARALRQEQGNPVKRPELLPDHGKSGAKISEPPRKMPLPAVHRDGLTLRLQAWKPDEIALNEQPSSDLRMTPSPLAKLLAGHANWGIVQR